MKRRDRPNTAYSLRQEHNSKVVGILKRLLRRLQTGQQMPFLVATIEPVENDEGRLVAAPQIVSLRLNDPEVTYLVRLTLDHLEKVGALKFGKAEPKPAAEGEPLTVRVK